MYRNNLEDLEIGARTVLERGEEMMYTVNSNSENGVIVKDKRTRRWAVNTQHGAPAHDNYDCTQKKSWGDTEIKSFEYLYNYFVEDVTYA